MTQEAYCSDEVCKLLKERGFKEPCTALNRLVIKDGEKPFMKITHQKAMAWLRKEHYIYADPIKQGNYNDCSEYYTWIVARMGIIHRNSSVADKLSYEDAVEAALKYALENLI